ncbi:cyanophycin synthetase [Sulfobacillus acidophilus TPY]|uniref:Cyanophycin synthetase n=1 Tax=Sulfobacillus acidophilus (strain ATCC 700253 / DSM 10332 / NAL) TaxID=679936 RepID=G8TW93_SULAD|nr:cyanophycin synthetase [Sulfobacillus acidophilus TPY]AEW03736.1 cyanophycin synthetase [Sulfobacillus acidophilus DSM 10332]
MEILSTRFYPGPNRHTLFPALEAILDLQGYGAFPTSRRPSFIAALLEGLPGLRDHHCSRGRPGGFVERLTEGTYLGHVVEHVALELLFQGGETGIYGKTREIQPPRVRVVFESETADGGRLALETAIGIVTRLWDGQPVDWPALFLSVRNQLARYHLGPSTRAIVAEARRRGIPVERLDQDNWVRLGQGVRQRRIMATMTDATSIISVELAQSKWVTRRVLDDAGIPVPQARLVHHWEEAWEAAQAIGMPVVVKPLAGHQGRGVTMGVDSRAALRRAWETAHEGSSAVLVEQQVPGTAYRLLVIGSNMVAATERIPPFVVGDGQQTIRALVDRLNQDPRRGPDHGFPMSEVQIDADAVTTLTAQGWTLEDVPPVGHTVWIRRTANMSTGALARDVTDGVHPDLADDAVRAARALGLDVAGVDIVTPRLDRGLSEAGGAVVEVNAAPGLRMHLYPAEGTPRPVDRYFVDWLFPDDQGRIPVAAVTGTNGKTTVTRMIAHIMGLTGQVVGMATTDGITIGRRVIQTGDLTGPWSARLILNDPTVEVAVLETARGGMARGGLGFDALDVAVVTNIGPDHLGQDDIQTLDDLVHLKALLVDVVRPDGYAVLNADDEWVLRMRSRSAGQTVLFSTKSDNPLVARHVETGGRAVYVKRGYLVYAAGGRETRLIGTRALPASLGGVATINIANAAAAAAAGLMLGAPPSQVAKGLASFPVGAQGLNRGRLELLGGPDLRVLIDYGHNAPAIVALGEICRRLRARRVITVLGLPGDRRDEDIRESARAAAAFSDQVIIREDFDRRGRQPGEVAQLIQAAIRAEHPDASIQMVLDEKEAVTTAIRQAGPGSLVLVLYERYPVVRQAAEEALHRVRLGSATSDHGTFLQEAGI